MIPDYKNRSLIPLLYPEKRYGTPVFLLVMIPMASVIGERAIVSLPVPDGQFLPGRWPLS